jgi:hypothetical protein
MRVEIDCRGADEFDSMVCRSTGEFMEVDTPVV